MTDTDNMVVKSGESVSRQTVVNLQQKTVRKFNVSNNKVTGHNYKVNWVFDFSDCTQDEIYELAAQSAVIAYRKYFRNVPESSIPGFADKTIDVHKEICAVEKRGLSVEEKAQRLISQMTDEQKAELLASLNVE